MIREQEPAHDSSPTSSRRTVAVIGGGMTGLAAARRLAAAGCAVSLFEAGKRLGGQVRTVEVSGHPVDIGAESLHLAGPAITDLLTELGLTDELVVAESSFAWIWDGRRRRRLPAGVGPAGPTRLLPVMQARVLSPFGMLRAAAEALVPSSRDWADEGKDVAVGPFIASRFGRQVTDRLVDPVLGSLHAGDIDRLSLRAATPTLAAKAVSHRSLLLGSAHGSRPVPAFVSFRGGLTTLVDRMLSDTDVGVHLETPIRSVTTASSGYRLEVEHGELGPFDGVVVALPAAPAARVLGHLVPTAAEDLTALRTASVATVVVAYPRAAVEDCPAMRATGVLTMSRSGLLLKAATFLGTKWPHLHDEHHYLLRMSAGRAGETRLAGLDDHELVEQLLVELGRATGLTDPPVLSRVERWPESLPQLEVGHLGRLAAIRVALGRFPGLTVAGAAYDGLGIATCVRSGNRAAAEVCDRLTPPLEVST